MCSVNTCCSPTQRVNGDVGADAEADVVFETQDKKSRSNVNEPDKECYFICARNQSGI